MTWYIFHIFPIKIAVICWFSHVIFFPHILVVDIFDTHLGPWRKSLKHEGFASKVIEVSLKEGYFPYTSLILSHKIWDIPDIPDRYQIDTRYIHIPIFHIPRWFYLRIYLSLSIFGCLMLFGDLSVYLSIDHPQFLCPYPSLRLYVPGTACWMVGEWR